MFVNQIKTAVLLASLSGLLLFFGYMIGGFDGIYFAFIISMLLNFVTYFWGDKIVLKMYGAQPLDTEKYSHIHEMVSDLADDMNMPAPKLWYIPTQMANAFATGRNPKNSSVAVTQGIIDILDNDELRGVLSHELSHVKNRDILIGTVAATLATTIGYLASMLRWSVILGGRGGRDRGNGFGVLIISILMPIAAMLIQLAVSRSREYLADETGAKHSRDPLALASALEKLTHHAKAQKVEPTPSQATTASLFIVYPFSGTFWISLFSTHPPMEKRIARLRNMAN
jgi:heat shock protein HtpX